MEKQIKRLSFSFLPIPEELMRSKSLSFGAKFLFGIIAKTNLEEVKMSVDYLSKRMGCSRSETKSRIRELKDNNLLIVKRTGRSNIYKINFELVHIIQEEMSTNEDIRETHSEAIRGTVPLKKNAHIKEHLKRNILKDNIFDFKKEKEKLMKKVSMCPDHQLRTSILEQVAKAERQLKAGKNPKI